MAVKKIQSEESIAQTQPFQIGSFGNTNPVKKVDSSFETQKCELISYISIVAQSYRAWKIRWLNTYKEKLWRWVLNTVWDVSTINTSYLWTHA